MSLCPCARAEKAEATRRAYRSDFELFRAWCAERHVSVLPASPESVAWILAPSATGLSKPDLHVFAKLFEDCLKRGLEAQAFSGREIGGHDDVLNFLVGHFVDVDLTRQPAS